MRVVKANIIITNAPKVMTIWDVVELLRKQKNIKYSVDPLYYEVSIVINNEEKNEKQKRKN